MALKLPAPNTRIGIPRAPFTPPTPVYNKPTNDERLAGAPIDPFLNGEQRSIANYHPYVPQPKPNFSPDSDPTFLAFQRALGLDEQQARADVAQQLDRTRSAYQAQLPTLEDARRRSIEQIAMQHAARGTWSSSARLHNQDLSSQYYDTQRSNLATNEAQSEGDFESQLARHLADNQLKLADETGNAVDRLDRGWGQSEADRRAVYDSQRGDAERASLARQDQIRSNRRRSIR